MEYLMSPIMSAEEAVEWKARIDIYFKGYWARKEQLQADRQTCGGLVAWKTERHRRWHKANPDRNAIYVERRRAATLGSPINDFTSAQWEALKAQYRDCCAYCGQPCERLTQDHVVPLSKGGAHTASNIVPACLPCNLKKHTKDVSMLPDVQGPALSLIEQSEYVFHCEVIKRGLSTFLEVGQSLMAVRDKRLYRHLYPTFEAYCDGEYQLARRTAYQLMAASEVVENVRNCAQIPANEAQARPLTSLEPDEQREVWSLAVETAPDGHVTAAHVQAVVNQHYFLRQGSSDVEWYTPQIYIDAAREVLGSIDLDPATCLEAQDRIKATRCYTVADQALMQDWSGRVWLNPPFLQPGMGQFVEKLLAELTAGRVPEAILVSHNYTDTAWFHEAAATAQCVCFTLGRIHYERSDQAKHSPQQGDVFYYFGPHVERFAKVFGAFGLVMQRMR